jgi:hypothetical protein
MIQYNYIYFFSYKRKLQEMLDDEDEIQTQKRIRFEEVSKLVPKKLVLNTLTMLILSINEILLKVALRPITLTLHESISSSIDYQRVHKISITLIDCYTKFHSFNCKTAKFVQ